ncbi:hypothetical protein [Pradoshia sp.]
MTVGLKGKVRLAEEGFYQKENINRYLEKVGQMILFNIVSILVTLLIIGFGLYFLKFKKEKNRTSFILGYCYLLMGVIGLMISSFEW